MSLSADSILERLRLKNQLMHWRFLSIALGVLLLLTFVSERREIWPFNGNYIARVEINGIIEQDFYRDEVLKSLKDDDSVKAVIVHINSPGGTVVGGETIFHGLKEISSVKPVVAVMDTMATSAAYMVSLGADHIFAHKGTLTGSIGVIMHSPNVVDLLQKFGVNMEVIKSGPFKASPSPFEKPSSEVTAVMQEVISDYFETFISMVSENRKLDREYVLKLADGRVYTGPQAFSNKLVDAIGGEKDALAWLKLNKNISTSHIIDVSLLQEEGGFNELFGSKAEIDLLESLKKSLKLQGLLSIWIEGIVTL